MIKAYMIFFIVAFLPNCVAQQPELAGNQKDLEREIARTKEEKKALGLQMDETREQLTNINEGFQRTRGNLDSINHKATFLQEKDIASLYGKFEETELNARAIRKDMTNQMELLHSDIQSLRTDIQQQEKELDEIKTLFNSKVKLLEQEISNLKSNQVEFFPEEHENLEPGSKSVYEKAIPQYFLDFAEKKKEVVSYLRACFLNDWTIPVEYQTMLKSEAYFKIHQLISRHENAVLAWGNCFNNLRENLAVLWSQFNSEIKPLTLDFGSSEPKLVRAMQGAEKSLKGLEGVVEETIPKIIHIHKNLSAYFTNLKNNIPATDKHSFLSIPEESQILEDEVFRSLRKQANSALDEIKF